MQQRLDQYSSEDPSLDFEILLVNNLQNNFPLMKDEQFVVVLDDLKKYFSQREREGTIMPEHPYQIPEPETMSDSRWKTKQVWARMTEV
jgi:hypothetical protein